MSNYPEGFVDCEQCQGSHRPTAGVCVWRLMKDAAFVLDGSGAVLSRYIVEWVLRELDIKEGYRYVSGPEQRRAYLLAGGKLTQDVRLFDAINAPEKADDGAEWVTKVDLPADVLLIETDRAFGLVKNLAALPHTQEEEPK